MRREGRLHGNTVRYNRRLWGLSNGKRASSKPTNQSKTHMHIAVRPHPFELFGCYSEPTLPKGNPGTFKENDMDINNIRMITKDWSVTKRVNNKTRSDGGCTDPYCDHWECDYNNDDENDDEEQGARGDRGPSEMVLPLVSLMVSSRRKTPSKTPHQLPLGDVDRHVSSAVHTDNPASSVIETDHHVSSAVETDLPVSSSSATDTGHHVPIATDREDDGWYLIS